MENFKENEFADAPDVEEEKAELTEGVDEMSETNEEKKDVVNESEENSIESEDDEDTIKLRKDNLDNLENKSIKELEGYIDDNIKQLNKFDQTYRRYNLCYKCMIGDIAWAIKAKCEEKDSQVKWIDKKQVLGQKFGKGNTNLEMCMRLAKVEDVTNFKHIGSTKLNKVVITLQQNKSKVMILDNEDDDNCEESFNLKEYINNFVNEAEQFTIDAIFKESEQDDISKYIADSKLTNDGYNKVIDKIGMKPSITYIDTIIKGLDGCNISYNGKDVSEFFKNFKGILRHKQFADIIEILSRRKPNSTKLLKIVKDLDHQNDNKLYYKNGAEIDIDALIDTVMEEMKEQNLQGKSLVKCCFEKYLEMRAKMSSVA